MSIVENVINDYGLWAVFLLILLEYACLPVSSEIILPLAGLAAAACGMSYISLVLFSTLSGLIGTSLTYMVGRFGGSPLLEKIMKRYPSWEKPLLRSYRSFGDHGKSAVFISRLIPLCRTYIGFIAGAMKQSFLSYIFCSAFGILLWNSVLSSLGYYFYSYRGSFFYYFNQYKYIIFFGSLSVLIIFLLYKWRASRRKSEKGQDT